jgi:hypothetical protein
VRVLGFPRFPSEEFLFKVARALIIRFCSLFPVSTYRNAGSQVLYRQLV